MLTQAKIAESGTADSYLKAAHIYRTRRVHQITALILATLQQEAYQTYIDDSINTVRSLENWKEMMQQCPTFRVWDMILSLELNVLRFICSEREGNFDLYVSTLQELMYLFFALDHPNYSRWLSVHIHDMLSMDGEFRELLSHNWTLQKTGNRFSKIPLDQVNEQQNDIIKGKGGIIGLTENPTAMSRWMVWPRNFLHS